MMFGESGEREKGQSANLLYKAKLHKTKFPRRRQEQTFLHFYTFS